MWPWEHLAVGYVLFSLAYHVYAGRSPNDAMAVAVVVGTQFPDFVDKPLAWTFAVLPSGVSVAHSVFVASALSLLAVLLAYRVGHTAVGAGFAVGYLVHLPADAIYPVVLRGELNLEAYFWPLVATQPGGRAGFVENFGYYLLEFAEFLATPRGMTFLVLEATLLAVTLVWWRADGYPGPGILRRALGTSGS